MCAGARGKSQGSSDDAVGGGRSREAAEIRVAEEEAAVNRGQRRSRWKGGRLSERAGALVSADATRGRRELQGAPPPLPVGVAGSLRTSRTCGNGSGVVRQKEETEKNGKHPFCAEEEGGELGRVPSPWSPAGTAEGCRSSVDACRQGLHWGRFPCTGLNLLRYGERRWS